LKIKELSSHVVAGRVLALSDAHLPRWHRTANAKPTDVAGCVRERKKKHLNLVLRGFALKIPVESKSKKAFYVSPK